MQNTMPARIQSAKIITFLRLTRSFRMPGAWRHEELRQHLQHEGESDGLRLARVLEQQAVDRYRVKPVADFADDLRQPQQPEIPVAPEQAQVAGE